EFFLAMGVYFLSRLGKGQSALLCGLALSAAFACRPTGIFFLAAVGVYLLITDRKALKSLVVGALPLLLAVVFYNYHYFGNFHTFGQSISGAENAMAMTGSDRVWQTPLWLGAAGFLVCPSRGLVFYSPFVLFAFPTFYLVWRRKELSFMRPVVVALAALLLLTFKYYKWWGGWTFGYRLFVDTMPIFAVMLVPIVDWLWRRRFVMPVFMVLLGWSIFVQIIGAYAYNVVDWNLQPNRYVVSFKREGTQKTVFSEDEAVRILRSSADGGTYERMGRNVDELQHRHRLWSLKDSQIVYYIRNFASSRRQKQVFIEEGIMDPER
ncbi:hypothetical protein LCGC14_2491580, partial [marine sediment metagenome]